MRLHPGEVGRPGVAVEDDAEFAAGGGGVLLGEQDHRGRVADFAGAACRSSRAARAARACPAIPRRAWVAIVHAVHPGSQPVLAAMSPVSARRRRLVQRLAVVAARRREDRGDQAHQQPDAGLAPGLGGAWRGPASVPRGRTRPSRSARWRASPARGVTGSASQPCRAASAMASSQRCRATAKEWLVEANPRWARQAPPVGRPMPRARAAPSRRCRSLSASRSDHASVTPRFRSATACRSLPSAVSAFDWPSPGRRSAPPARRCCRSARVAAPTASPRTRWPSAAGAGGQAASWRRTPWPRAGAHPPGRGGAGSGRRSPGPGSGQGSPRRSGREGAQQRHHGARLPSRVRLRAGR